MEFKDKLEKLLKGRQKQAVAEAAGLVPSALSNFTRRGNVPRADVAFKLAKALDVPLDWLVDDEADFPPPENGGRALKDYEDREIMRDVARRYRLVAVELRTKIRAVDPSIYEDVEARWAELLGRALETPLDKPLDQELEDALDVAGGYSSGMFKINALMPDRFARLMEANGDDLPGKGEPDGPLDADSLRDDYAKIVDQNPIEAKAMMDLIGYREAYDLLPERREEFAFYIDSLARSYKENRTIPTQHEMMQAWQDRPMLKAAKRANPRRG